MTATALDAVDHTILYALQQDARRQITDIADEANVSDNTVRNRIEKLEADGVIKGYHATVDYDRAGVPHHYMFVCTARVSEREKLVREVRDLPGVVEVTSLMTGTFNIFITAAARTKQDITDLAYKIDGLGLAIEREQLIWEKHRRPSEAFRSPDGTPRR